jgi:hypothetical protein
MVLHMNYRTTPSKPDIPRPILPKWIMQGAAAQDIDNACFSSGSALALLHVALHDPDLAVPADLLRSRLALRAAMNCCKIEGRSRTEAELRDACLLTVPGDAMGPDGDMLAFWRAGIRVRLGNRDWQTRITTLVPEDLHEITSEALDLSVSGAGGPVAKSYGVLTRILAAAPRHEAVALLCADAVLSHALGWSRPMPLLSLHLRRSDMRQIAAGEDARVAVHLAAAHAAQDVVRLSHDLARRAGHLKAVASKLRSKGSEDAIRLFLTEDAVLPSLMLSPKIHGSDTSMTGRSARRLCDRLVELGAVREMTGRKMFRLYGVA